MPVNSAAARNDGQRVRVDAGRRSVPDAGRRSVVPPAAGRSLWLAAAWTGLGTLLVGAFVSIVAVALCWLPVSGADGNANSAIRAGLLTFLAGLHGGITVDGLDTAFVPLGLMIGIAILAWRAGTGLADAAEELDETNALRLLQAGCLQIGVFAVACGITAGASSLGTSSVPIPGAVIGGALLFAATGGTAFVRATALGDELAARTPYWLAPAARVAAAITATYLAAGALLVAGSLVLHHGAVAALSRQVGGGWSGLPVLLLGLLAAPNAALAGASYLTGPGFAVGSGTTVALTSTPKGTLPAFPVLGALPTGPAPWPVWVLGVLTPLAAGGCAGALAARMPRRAERWRVLGIGVAGSALFSLVLAWLAGGGIGSGRLHAIGASPWQYGLAVALGSAVVAAAVLGVQAAVEALDSTQQDGLGIDALRGLRTTVATVAAEASTAARGEPDGTAVRGASDGRAVRGIAADGADMADGRADMVDSDEDVRDADDVAKRGKRAG